MVHYYNSALRELDGRLVSGGRVPLFVEWVLCEFSSIVDADEGSFFALCGFLCDFWISAVLNCVF